MVSTGQQNNICTALGRGTQRDAERQIRSCLSREPNGVSGFGVVRVNNDAQPDTSFGKSVNEEGHGDFRRFHQM